MILKFELSRMMKKNLIGYISITLISIILFLLFNVVIFNESNIKNILANSNQKVLAIFDINKDTFTTVIGYYGFIFKILSIICAIYSINLGIEVATFDKKNNIRDFLYSKPIKRKNIILYRILGAFIYIFSLTLIIFLLSILLFSQTHCSYNVLDIIKIDLALLLLMIMFFSLGIVIGGFNHQAHSWIISVTTLLIFFIIHIVDILVPFKFLYFINPLSYFNVTSITQTNIDLKIVLVTLFIIAFLLSFGISVYENKLNEEKK